MSRKFEVALGFENRDLNLPKRSTAHSAGYDFECAEEVTIKTMKDSAGKPTLVKTGIKATFGEDEVLHLYNRSSNPGKKGLVLANGVGVVESDYYNNPSNDGHIMFAFLNFSQHDAVLKIGDKIGQGVFQKFLLVDGDEASGERSGGFGSTGA